MLMEKYLNEFKEKLKLEGKSEHTINSYLISMNEYLKWFADTYGNTEFKCLYRTNVLEYKNYLKILKKISEGHTISHINRALH